MARLVAKEIKSYAASVPVGSHSVACQHVRRQTIARNNADSLLIGPSGINVSEISCDI